MLPLSPFFWKTQNSNADFKNYNSTTIIAGNHTMARSHPENLVGGAALTPSVTSQSLKGQYGHHLSTTSSTPDALQSATDFTAFDPHTTLEISARCFLFSIP